MGLESARQPGHVTFVPYIKMLASNYLFSYTKLIWVSLSGYNGVMLCFLFSFSVVFSFFLLYCLQ